jgi:hypothetical protein
LSSKFSNQHKTPQSANQSSDRTNSKQGLYEAISEQLRDSQLQREMFQRGIRKIRVTFCSDSEKEALKGLLPEVTNGVNALVSRVYGGGLRLQLFVDPDTSSMAQPLLKDKLVDFLVR